jgi:hypothetical protein
MEGIIKREHPGGAKFHTNVATLAPVGINKDLPARTFFLGLASRRSLSGCMHFFPYNLSTIWGMKYLLK